MVQVNESGTYFGDASARVPLFQVDPFIDNVSDFLLCWMSGILGLLESSCTPRHAILFVQVCA